MESEAPSSRREDAARPRGGRFALVAVAAGLFLALELATRLALVLLAGVLAAGPGALARSLLAGEVLDALAALWLTFPLTVVLALLPARTEEKRWPVALVASAFAVGAFATLLVTACEIVFFAELGGRFNFVAVDYLIYPHEVFEGIGESFPLGAVLAGIGALTALVVWLLRSRLRRPLAPARTVARLRFLTAHLAVAALATYLLPTDLARVSESRALNEVAESGYHTFVLALLGRDAPYRGLYATRGDEQVFSRLRDLLAEPAADPASFASASTRRHVRALAPERRWNVVVVLEESLGAEFVGALGRNPSLTPALDAIAAQGTLLTRAYSTGNRTVRAIEATTSGLPPLPGIATVRRPRSVELFTLPALLRARGYRTLFVYGGRSLFDNMGGYLLANGVERVVDQASFPRDAFRTAWGVADEAIFDRALAEMSKLARAGTPFYALILTVSNHRPFTYPDGRIAADPAEKSRLNAVAYADWALGRFLEQARRTRLFRRTLFVLMGDHGARVYGALEVPLASYRVPVVFYAPGLVPGGVRVDTLASSLDVPPTVLALLGIDYESMFFGRDVLRLPADAGRAPLIHNHTLALLSEPGLAVLRLRGESAVYTLGADGAAVEGAPDGTALVDDAIAYFQGADDLYRRGAYRLGASPPVPPPQPSGEAKRRRPRAHRPRPTAPRAEK